MRLRNQFLLTLLGTGALVLLVMASAVQFAFQNSLNQYLEQRLHQRLQLLAAEFADYYANYGSFDGIALRTLVWEAERGSEERLPPDLVLLDEEQSLLFGPPVPPEDLELEPVLVDALLVGWVGLPNSERFREAVEQDFSRRQQRLLLAIALASLALAVVGAWWLSRRLVRPVETVVDLSSRLSRGDYQARVATTRKDELGILIGSMNQLAGTLEQSRDSRQRWLADLSHELRTPVTVLRGELEAIQDGVRELTPARVDSLHREILHLGKLLDDLHDLALADAGALRYRMERAELVSLLQQSAVAIQPQCDDRQQHLQLQLPQAPIYLQGDALRLRQLLDNLLANACKYTDKGGDIRVTLAQEAQQIRLDIEDSAPGVTDAQLPLLFEHLYRTDSARQRATGGAGLGLAICQRIARAHGGQLSAAHSTLGGLHITLLLPTERSAPAGNTT